MTGKGNVTGLWTSQPSCMWCCAVW